MTALPAGERPRVVTPPLTILPDDLDRALDGLADAPAPR